MEQSKLGSFGNRQILKLNLRLMSRRLSKITSIFGLIQQWRCLRAFTESWSNSPCCLHPSDNHTLCRKTSGQTFRLAAVLCEGKTEGRREKCKSSKRSRRGKRRVPAKQIINVVTQQPDVFVCSKVGDGQIVSYRQDRHLRNDVVSGARCGMQTKVAKVQEG